MSSGRGADAALGFAPVDPQPDLPALEEQVLARWRERDVFARSLAQRAHAPLWTFYEGPPTANGKPGTHHVEARVFKDIFPRYRTMKGYRVPRKAGWDCHGIPVELQVERDLGITRKPEIEAYGVAEFNRRCRESVVAYVEDWSRLTERIAYWVDLDDAYWTMTPSYVESVWWSLKQLWEAGLIYEGHRVVPYCPRCGTPLSDHEVAQGYAQAEDPSIYVRLPLLDGPFEHEGVALLVWTTTPWTLISNTAVALGPEIHYVLARDADANLVILAAERVAAVLGEDAAVLRDVAVDELRGLHYRAPFDYWDAGADWRYVTVGDFVTTADGTGIVHLAPAFGADDYAVAQSHGLPVHNPVDAEGRFDARVTDFAGQFVKDADPAIIEALRDRGVLHSAGRYVHTYPFCWRCSTPLLYYAMPSWYIATTQVRERLLEVNAGTDWHPPHVREGRYGDWLANNVDWALSRTRYWGTPLPLWRCTQCSTVTCVGSRAELTDLTGTDQSGLDPHRPFVDDLTFACPSCGGEARRVPDVIDAWYDSGAMPFAQLGYPHAPGSEERFSENFPADYICEALDQTRGWFYSLMAISTLLFDRGSYRTVLVLGLIVDADGRKMSKSIGNILDPWGLIEAYGADPLRWLLLTDGSPWVDRRVGQGPISDVVRKFVLPLWNSYAFFSLYARHEGWTPEGSHAPPVRARPVMDRWILAELAEVVGTVDERLEAFDATTAGRAIQGFLDDLSNWYIRRSRSRFWRTASGLDAADAEADQHAAFATLHECLVTVTALLAPFTPMLADALYDNLVRAVDPRAPDSVHLLDFPVPDAHAGDAQLRAAMKTARQVVEQGRRARNDAKVGVRQPLPRALVTLPVEAREGWHLVADVVAEELNVKSLEVADGASGTVTYLLKPSFRELGKAFGPRTQHVAAALAELNAEAAAHAVAVGEPLVVTVDGEAVGVEPAMVQVIEQAREGWQVAADGPVSVALDLTVDDALRREGVARELVRAINDLRKRHDLALGDRVAVEFAGDDELGRVFEAHGGWIAGEVLAVTLHAGAASGGEFLEVAGHTVRVRLEVVDQPAWLERTTEPAWLERTTQQDAPQ